MEWLIIKLQSGYLKCLCLSGAAFLVVMDTTIANIALPVINGTFGVSDKQGLWILVSYSLAHAISMLFSGRLTSKAGELCVFKKCVLLFILASLGGGIATNFIVFVLFRALQGLAAGPIIPLSQSLLLRKASIKQRSELLSVWSGFVVTAPLVGPIIGGYICEKIHWAWIFLINIPVGVFIYFGILISCNKNTDTPEVSVRFNWIGFVLWVLSSIFIQFIMAGNSYIDHDSIYFKFMIFFCLYIMLIAFAWDFYSKNNVMHLHLLKNKKFLIGVFFLFLSYIVNFGSLLPVVLTTQFNYSPLMIGIVTSPSAIAPLLFSRFVGRLCSKIEPAISLIFGFFLYFVVFYWRSHYLQQETPFFFFAWASFFEGIASLFFYIPIALLTFSGINNDDMAKAATLSSFLRIQISAMGSMVTYNEWSDRFIFHVYRLNELINDNNLVYSYYVEKLMIHGFDKNNVVANVGTIIKHSASIMAIDDLYFLNSYMYLFMAILLSIITVFFSKTKTTSQR